MCPPDFVCDRKGTSPLICVRRPLFPKFSEADVVASVLAFWVAVLAAIAGMGGGELLLPIYILAAGFAVHEAIPLGQVTSLGGAVVTLIINLMRHHPVDSRRSIIAYLPLQYIMPPMVVGNVFGVFVQTMSPIWFIVSLLVIVLGYASYATTHQSIVMYSKHIDEQKSISEKSNPSYKAIRQEDAGSDEEDYHDIDSDDSSIADDNSDISESVDDNDVEGPIPSLLHESQEDSKLLRASYKQIVMREHAPWIYQFQLLLFLVAVIATTLCRGGNPRIPSVVGVHVCSPMFWVITALTVPVLLSFMIYPAFRLKWEHTIKEKLHCNHQSGEIVWSFSHLITYPLLFFVVGLVSGMIGISGGIFISPLLLALGLFPEVAVATSATSVFINALSSSLNFYVLDQLLLDYAAWYFGIGIAGALFGALFMRWLFIQFKLVHIVGFVVAGLICIGTVLMVYVGVVQLVNGIKTNTNLVFKGFCRSVAS